MKNPKKLLSIALTMLMVLTLLPVTAVPAQALELGTPEDPIRISTAAELNLIRYNLDKHYILVNDIDLSGYESWNRIGTPDESSAFRGSLDGNWHTISNLKINETDNYFLGLFGYICKPAVIKNLRLTNVNVVASSISDVGGLVGGVRNDLGTGDNVIIENCYIDGAVSNTEEEGIKGTGGLVGSLYSYSSPGPTIRNCWSEVAVTGVYTVGGLVGSVYNASVENSYSTDIVSAPDYMGGLVGDLTGVSNVSNCYATGDVQSDGANTGGLIGTTNATVSNSYYDSDTTGKSDTGKGEPKNTVEMKTPATFSGWDTDIWNLTDAQYPILKVFNSTTYTVTYDIGGGSGDVPMETSKAAFASFEVADPAGLTPPVGKAFKQWNTAADGSGTSYYVGQFVGMPAENLTLYAIWAPQYTLTYNANGGSNPPESTSYFEGDLFRIASKTGMTEPADKQFVKWNTADDGSGTNYYYSDLVSMPANDLTLYAIWEPFQDGSKVAPYLVNDFEDLWAHMDENDKHFKQTANITLPDPEEFGEDSNWIPTETFSGSFDGGGFTISNLIINSDKYPAMGLFGDVASVAVLKNINLVDAEITSTFDDVLEIACVGALVGYNEGTIQNCTVSGTVSGI
ncbi:MAG: InlB B-repeat-containing protein [Clostridiales bacterium]|nr:InlB B-repeat-containing protein [Clostridiales bacterium]